MKYFRSFVIASTIFLSLNAHAQGVMVQGLILDVKDTSSQIGVAVVLTNAADSTKLGMVTDLDGKFIFENVLPATYTLTTTYVGYLPLSKEVVVGDKDLDLGVILISQDDKLLKEVVVKDKEIRAQQLGDTTQFNANAFKTNQNATVEDLVTKMPGITMENGVMKVQGEALQKVTIDGEDFFGDDATVALKNLPAEIVDKVQVFDRLSDQAQFTGFDDGNTQKTLNIVTKSGKANGQFGKIYAGYGTDDRYIGGANVNYFKGKRRIALVGLTNNINQQNFTSQDLLGVTGNVSNGGGGRGGGGRGGGGQGGNSASNFTVGQQPGISKVNSIGLNYSDSWGKKVKVNGSYFFNNSSNTKTSQLTREYFLTSGTNQLYDESNYATSNNFNHRINARLDYTIDSANSITLRPQISFQDNSSISNFLGKNYFTLANPLNITNNQTMSDNKGYSFSNDLLYRHRFSKRGRSVSINLGTSVNDKSGTRRSFSKNQYFADLDTTITVDQLSLTQSDGLTLSSNVAFTEPIAKDGQLQINYTPSYNRNQSNRETNDLDANTNQYSLNDSLLSNQFDNTVLTQKTGMSYRLRKKVYNFSIGLNYQNVHLNSMQLAPKTLEVDKVFQNILPDASFNFSPSKAENMRIQYRTSTRAPNVTQLQNVLDNTNQLLLSIGNPDLKQTYNHTFTVRYNKNNATKATNFLAYAYLGLNNNVISNSTFFATRDTTVLNNINLLAGSQLVRPVNLNGNWNARSLFTFGVPLSFIKSNLNLSTGFSYQHTPSLVNNVLNAVNAYTTNLGVVISSNISEKIDFNISYSANFNVVRNELQPKLNNNYFYHNAGVKFSWEIAKHLTLTNDLNQTLYTGLGTGFNQQYWLWNAAIGYRMLPKEALEIRLGVFDLLNQNDNITRNVSDAYIEDSVTNVLKRYVMLTAIYTLRNFGK